MFTVSNINRRGVGDGREDGRRKRRWEEEGVVRSWEGKEKEEWVGMGDGKGR